MTVCRYYLQGTCRFGNRCRFEHVDPEHSRSSDSNSIYSNRRNDYGYQDRYRYQENYQERSNKYENQELSFGPRRYNNFDKQTQNFRSEKYGQYDNYKSYSNLGQSYRDNSYDNSYYKEDYSRYTSNQRYSSPERQSSNSRPNFRQSYHDDSYNQKNYSTYSSNQRYSSPERQGPTSRYDSSFQKVNPQYDKTQYEWVSEDYKAKTQHQKKELSSPETSQSQRGSKAFSFKNLDGDKNEDVNEEIMILAERVKEDAIAWELGNQWPFTCYSPLPRKGEFPGFSDISFEELRYEALKAEESNSFDYFVQNITEALLDIQNKRNKLKQPTENLLTMIEKLRAGEYLSKAFETKAEVPVMNFPQSVQEDIADEAPLNTQSSMPASSFSFKTTLDKDSHVTNGASSSFSFKSILDPSSTQSMQSSSTSSFSFKVPETGKPSISMLSSNETDDDYPMYTPIEALSEQDRKQFTASTFTLGKIPTVPPPKILCF